MINDFNFRYMRNNPNSEQILVLKVALLPYCTMF